MRELGDHRFRTVHAPLSFLARATMAIRLPRLRAIRSAQSRSACVSGLLVCVAKRQAASTSSQRMRELPALVMLPRLCTSLELHSRGTSPG